MFSESFGAALAAQFLQGLPDPFDFGARRFDLLAQTFEFLVASFDLAQSLRSALAERNHFGDRAAVFAFQRFEERNALLEGGELFRIEIELFGVLAERTRNFRKFDDAGGMRLGQHRLATGSIFSSSRSRRWVSASCGRMESSASERRREIAPASSIKRLLLAASL